MSPAVGGLETCNAWSASTANGEAFHSIDLITVSDLLNEAGVSYGVRDLLKFCKSLTLLATTIVGLLAAMVEVVESI